MTKIGSLMISSVTCFSYAQILRKWNVKNYNHKNHFQCWYSYSILLFVMQADFYEITEHITKSGSGEK